MEASGWLEVSSSRAGSKARRMYRITPAGNRVLAALRDEVEELYAVPPVSWTG